MHRPTKDPHARPAIATLERLHTELGGKLLENRQNAQDLGGRCFTLKPASRCWTRPTISPGSP